MAYQIEYDMKTVKIIKKNTKKEVLSGLVLVLTLVLGSIGAHFGGTLLQTLFLGETETAQAAEQLIDDIRSGVEVRDAVQTFCAELIR